jgi:tagaturonate reductase
LTYAEREKKMPERLVYSLGALIRFYKGEWRGEKIPVNDATEVVEFFHELWKLGDNVDIARSVLSNKKLWDADLTVVPGLTELVAIYLDQLSKVEKGDEKMPVFH